MNLNACTFALNASNLELNAVHNRAGQIAAGYESLDAVVNDLTAIRALEAAVKALREQAEAVAAQKGA